MGWNQTFAQLSRRPTFLLAWLLVVAISLGIALASGGAAWPILVLASLPIIYGGGSWLFERLLVAERKAE